MDGIMNLISDFKSVLLSVLLILIISYFIYRAWENVSYWWLRVLCNFPVIGKISRLSKNHAYDPEKAWFSSEREICAEFHPYFEKSDVKPSFFEDCSSYLRKVQETGRKNLSLFGWILLSIVVFIEAMGFSYVLAGWTIPGASEALKEQGAFGIAILISGLLVFLTHATGHEQHKNSLIKKVRTWYTQSAEQNYKMIPNNKVSLDNERIDDEEPEWRQLLNRISVNDRVTPTNKVTILTLLFVIIIAIGSTYVRGQVLESEQAEQNANPAEIMWDDSAYSFEDPYAEQSVNELPAELIGAQSEVDEQVQNSKKDADRKGAWTTFMMLAVIFVFLQIMGIVIGYRTGFAGKESATAKDFTGKFRTSEEFSAYHERIRDKTAQQAQKVLEKLQARMVENAQKYNIDGTAINHLKNTKGRNFYAYVASIRDSRDTHEQSKQATTMKSSAMEPPVIASAASLRDISEDEISVWMEKLGWDRTRTVELLKKHKAKQQKAVSEEDALALLEAEQTPQLSEEEAEKMLNESLGKSV